MSEKYSYSKIDKYAQCPFSYYLKYVLGNYISGKSIALELGSAIHAAEETIGNHIKNKEQIPYESIISSLRDTAKVLAEKYPKEFNTPDKVGRMYEDKIEEYVTSGIYNLEMFFKNNSDVEYVGAEIPFEVHFNDKLFTGSIDRVFFNKTTGKYIIQDIKTYAEAISNSKLAVPLQFVVYTLAAKKLFNVSEDKIECQYYLPFCNLTQGVTDNSYFSKGLLELQKIFNKINSKQFAPKPCALCHWCEYCPTNENATEEGKYLCPYFSKWRKSGDSVYITENKWEGLENHNDILEMYHRIYGIKRLTEEVK